MKRTIAISILGLGLAFAGGAFAGGDLHPHLTAAHKDLDAAAVKLSEAQKANEFDLEGHALKAQELMTQAMAEMKAARESAAGRKL